MIAHAPFNDQALRHALGAFATGITIVSTVTEDNRFEGLTVNSFSSVSLEPPLILWCLSCGAAEFPAFQKATHFAVNILAADQRPLSDLFASPSRSKFADLAVTEGLGGVPLLNGCLAILECRTEVIHTGGDHIILIGRVERLQRQSGEPLLYWEGGYRLLSNATPLNN